MGQIGTIRLQTQNSGTVDVPVFNTGDSGSSVYEMWRVQTQNNGVGFVPLTSTSDAVHDYLRVQTQNYGILAVHDSAATSKLIDSFEDNDISEYSSSGGTWNVVTGGQDGSYQLEGKSGDTSNYHLVATTGLNYHPQPGDTFRVWCKTNDQTEDDEQSPVIIFGANGPPRGGNSGYTVRMTNSGSNLDKIDMKRWDSGSKTTLAQNSPTDFALNTWYEFEVNWASDGTITFTVYDSTGTQMDQISATDTNYSYKGFGYGVGSGSASSGGATNYFDYARTI